MVLKKSSESPDDLLNRIHSSEPLNENDEEIIVATAIVALRTISNIPVTDNYE